MGDWELGVHHATCDLPIVEGLDDLFSEEQRLPRLDQNSFVEEMMVDQDNADPELIAEELETNADEQDDRNRQRPWVHAPSDKCCRGLGDHGGSQSFHNLLRKTLALLRKTVQATI